MIDLSKEVVYSLTPLAKKLPQRRSANTLRNWIVKGVTCHGMIEPVKMEHVSIGGVRHSSVEAYIRFVKVLTEAEIRSRE